MEKGEALHLNKLESPSPKDALCQVWLKLALWFWRRRFFNFVNVFSLFHNYLLSEQGGALHLNKLESPSPKDVLCQVWLKLARWFWRRRWKCEKFTDRRTDRQTDRLQTSGDLKAHLSFQLRWANKRHTGYMSRLSKINTKHFQSNIFNGKKTTLEGFLVMSMGHQSYWKKNLANSWSVVMQTLSTVPFIDTRLPFSMFFVAAIGVWAGASHLSFCSFVMASENVSKTCK